jgi:hypothetical protein
MRRGDGNETADALETAEPLQVVAGDEPAHAVADEIDLLPGREGALDVGGNLGGELIEADLTQLGTRSSVCT